MRKRCTLTVRPSLGTGKILALNMLPITCSTVAIRPSSVALVFDVCVSICFGEVGYRVFESLLGCFTRDNNTIYHLAVNIGCESADA